MDVDKPTMPGSGVAVAPKKKEKKPREKKRKAKAPEGSTSTNGDASMAAPAPKKRKAKESTKETEYKSKEFIDTSDDDLDFIPSKQTTNPLPSPSVPASAQLSVPPSAVVSDRRSTGTEASSSSVTILPSAAFSNPPSLQVSVPPSITDPSSKTAPCVELTPARDQLKKKKKTAKTLTGNGEDTSAGGPSSRGDETVAVPKKRARKDKKALPDSVPKDFHLDDALDSVVANVIKSKTTKKTNVVLSDEDNSDDERSFSKPTSTVDRPPISKHSSATTDKPKPSKKRTIASDDEDEESKAPENSRKSSVVPGTDGDKVSGFYITRVRNCELRFIPGEQELEDSSAFTKTSPGITSPSIRTQAPPTSASEVLHAIFHTDARRVRLRTHPARQLKDQLAARVAVAGVQRQSLGEGLEERALAHRAAASKPQGAPAAPAEAPRAEEDQEDAGPRGEMGGRAGGDC